MNLALQWVLLGCSLVFLSNFITHLKNLNFNSWLLKGQNDCFLHLPLSDLISLPFWSYYLKSKQGIPSVLSPGRVTHLYRIIYCGTSWVTPHPVDGQSAVKAEESPLNPCECTDGSAGSCPQRNLRVVLFCEASDQDHNLGNTEAAASWSGSGSASLLPVLASSS